MYDEKQKPTMVCGHQGEMMEAMSLEIEREERTLEVGGNGWGGERIESFFIVSNGGGRFKP